MSLFNSNDGVKIKKLETSLADKAKLPIQCLVQN
jgi:hypothetical protein